MRSSFRFAKWFAFSSLGALMAALPAVAQEAPRADEIIITAARAPQPANAVAPEVSVIDAETLRRSQAVSAVDALRDVPGIGFNRNGGPGGVTSVRIRGAETDQTVVLIDGVKLNDPAAPGGGFDFASLLIEDGARIEVLRGPQATLYGSQAIGGVINVITPDGTKAAAGFDLEAGGLDTRRARARISGTAYGVRYGLAGGVYETDGVSAFARARGGQERDGFSHTALSARLGADLTPDLALELRAWWTTSQSEIDGFPAPTFTFADTDERADTQQSVIYAGANLGGPQARLQQRFALVQTRIERDLLDPASAVPLTFATEGVNDRIEYQAIFRVDPALSLQWGLDRETARLTARAPTVFDPNPPSAQAKARLDGAYGLVQAQPAQGLTASLGVRLVHAGRFGETVTGQAALRYTPDGGVTSFRMTAGDGFKAPSLFQLFSDFGNLRLAPERAFAWDVSAERSFFDGALSASLSYFERTTKNQIDFISCAPGPAAICTGRPFGTYDNIARSKADGFEASLLWAPNADWRVSVRGWTLDARNATPGAANFGRALPRRAEETYSLEAVRRFGDAGEVSFSVTHIGDSFDDGANAVRLKGYTLATLRAQWRLTPAATLYGRIENLTDETYESAFGYGAMPRLAVIGIRAAF